MGASLMFTYYDEKSDRLRSLRTGRFVKFDSGVGRNPDETCPNGCVRYGDWWVPEDCPTHLGGGA